MSQVSTPVPGERTAVGRVVAAGHADLIAVIDRRRTRIGHLEQGRQPKRRLVAAGQGEEPRHVVAPQQVEHHAPVTLG